MLIKKLDAINGEIYLSSLVAFQKKLALESEQLELDEIVLTQGIQKVLFNDILGSYYVCTDSQDNLLGMLLLTKEWSDWRCKHVVWIHSVYIDSKHRHKGIFKALYLHIKSMVKHDEALAGIRLYVDKTNLDAVSVYQKLGMSDEHYSLFEWLND